MDLVLALAGFVGCGFVLWVCCFDFGVGCEFLGGLSWYGTVCTWWVLGFGVAAMFVMILNLVDLMWVGVDSVGCIVLPRVRYLVCISWLLGWGGF